MTGSMLSTPKAQGGGPALRGTRIQSVARGSRLLLWLARHPEGAVAKEIAFANRLTLATTYHILNTLVDQGLLAKDTRRRYVLGEGAAVLAQAYIRSTAPQPLLECLRGVALRTGAKAYLAGWDGGGIRVLAAADPESVLPVARLADYAFLDGHARANGKVLLAHVAPDLRARYFDDHPPRRLTAATKSGGGALESELARVREVGVAYDECEFDAAIACVSAPVLGKAGIVAALGLSVPAQSFEARRAELTEAALQASAAAETAVPATVAPPG